jgi:hypothetical protein
LKPWESLNIDIYTKIEGGDSVEVKTTQTPYDNNSASADNWVRAVNVGVFADTVPSYPLILAVGRAPS